MKQTLTAAIIGAGRIAGGFDRERTDSTPGIFTHAGAYVRDSRFVLKTVMDTDRHKAERFAGEWNIPQVETDLMAVCKAHYDVVSVCTPDETHSDVIGTLIREKAAKTIFAEKPLARTAAEIQSIRKEADKNGIHVVINFQRRFDPAHIRLQKLIASAPDNLRTGNAYYIKGLDHVGTTLVDTLRFLCGMPRSVWAYHKAYNEAVQDDTYEFILFFDTFNITVKTIDTEKRPYDYHIFELDFLFSDKRIVVNDNSRRMDTRKVIDYAYSDVRCLDDRHPVIEETDYALSMLMTVGYVYDITVCGKKHFENTPQSSYVNKCIVEAVKQSYREKQPVTTGELRG